MGSAYWRGRSGAAPRCARRAPPSCWPLRARARACARVTAPTRTQVLCLVRPGKQGQSPEQRLAQLLAGPVFSRLERRTCAAKVALLQGDVTRLGLGLQDPAVLG